MTTETIEVTTTRGIVRGLVRDGSAAFLGIPFAEPPVGARRFAAPVAKLAWTDVLDATAYGATPEREALSDVTAIPEPAIAGESTLNVNVFTPSPGNCDAALPVLLYLHGGGYVAGSPSSPWYDGAAFNRDGVVTVTVSYRLGFDGFGWIADAPHNRGILDWVVALEWVHDNIRDFGGDPGRVTVSGQSAGGGGALTLLAVPSAAGLFHGVISLSGATCDLPLETAEATGRALAASAGVDVTRAGFGQLDEDQILDLQVRFCGSVMSEGEDQLAALDALYSGAVALGPVIDGDILPRGVLESIAAGVGADKALLIGATDHEFKQALDIHQEELQNVEPVAVLRLLGPSDTDAARYRDLHPGLSTAAVVGQLVTDTAFRIPVLDHARVRDEATANTWIYRFSFRSPASGGATHCLDVPFFFDCLDAVGVEAAAGPYPPQGLADDVHGAAVSFVVAGDPGWPPYTDASRDVQIYGEPSAVVPGGFGALHGLAQPSAPATTLALVCALGLGLWPALA